MGEQFGGWLTYKAADEEPTNLEVLVSMFAQAYHKTVKFSGLQAASVNSRIANKYDAAIIAGLQKKMPIGWKLVLKGAEYLGFDIEEIMEKGELGQFLDAIKRNKLDELFAMENVLPTGNKPKW